MIENINEKTGEIIEFHTRFTTVPDAGEHYEPGTSMTDATQFEPIQSLIQRIVRPRTDLVWSDEEDPTDIPGFDLVDIPDVLDHVNSVVAEQMTPQDGASQSETQSTTGANPANGLTDKANSLDNRGSVTEAKNEKAE